MTEEPEHIWVARDKYVVDPDKSCERTVEYIRADIVDELVEALKITHKALENNQPNNYCINGRGERFPILVEDPFRFERNGKAIVVAEAALKKLEESHD